MSWINSWRKRQKITIDHTKVDENLQNFPVKVILPNGSSIFDYAQADGADIRFTAGDGATLLDFEREVHNKTEKIAVYHVKIPSISSTSDTDFYIYYDNPIAEDASNPNAVWDENYELVMHMTPDLTDSTSNSNDGTNYGATINLANDGYYASFDGVNDYISLINTFNFSDNYSVELLIDLSNVTSTQYFLGNISSTHGVRYNDSSFLVHNGIQGYTELNWQNTYETIHLHIKRTNSIDCNFYINGDYIGYHILGGSSAANINTIGKRQDIYYFNGIIYDIKFHSSIRSDSWIKATSESLHNTLLTLGEIETSNKTRMQVVFI